MKNSSFIFLALVLSSCAVRINTTGPRFESPESLGPLKEFELYGSFDQGHQVVMENNDLFGPAYLPDTENPRLARRNGISGGFRAGLWERLEVSFSAFSTLKTKFQILGEPAIRAKKGFALAIGAGVGAVTEGSNPFLIQDNSGAEVDGVLVEGVISLGYRINENALVFATPFYTHRGYEVESYNETRDSNGNVTGKTSIGNRKGYIQTQGVSLAAEFRAPIKSGAGHVGVRPEINYTEIKAGNRRRKDGFGGIQGYVHF